MKPEPLVHIDIAQGKAVSRLLVDPQQYDTMVNAHRHLGSLVLAAISSVRELNNKEAASGDR